MQRRIGAAKDETVSNVKHAFVEAKKNKFTFCLGVSSVFLAVVVVAIAKTVLAYTPIYFLKIAELQSGEADVIINPRGEALNYDKIESMFQGTDYQYSAPRIWMYSTPVYNPANAEIDFENKTVLYSGVGTSRSFLKQTITSSTGFINLIALDFKKETEIGLGRSWKYGIPQKGEVFLSQAYADLFNVKKGDKIIIEINARAIYNCVKNVTDYISSAQAIIYATPTVAAILPDSGGKFGTGFDYVALMDFDIFMEHVRNSDNPNFPKNIAAAVRARGTRFYATSVAFNLPPPRLKIYADSDFTNVEYKCVAFANHIVEKLGYSAVTADLSLLETVTGLSVLNLFLGLVISLILFVLAFMLMLLIYSLLMISVETKAFDLGVFRMIGMNRMAVVRYILSQTLVASVPAYAVGLIFSTAVSSVLLGAVASVAATDIPLGLSSDAVLWASVMGIAVPLFASIFPVRAALSQTLTDSLDISRSKTQGVVVTLERSADVTVPKNLLIPGVLITAAGIGTYYFFPLALLYGNLQLLMYLFFGLLLAMLFGLVLLSLNFERTVEKIVVHVSLFLVPRGIKALVLKNLIAHKMRNKKTTILYALSLGFVIFITMSFTAQITTQTFAEEQKKGGLLTLTMNQDAVVSPQMFKAIDETITTNCPEISSYTWYSGEMRFILGLGSTNMMNVGKTFSTGQHIYAISPNFLDSVASGFLDIDDERYESPASLTLSQQLYSPAGGQSGIIGSIYKTSLGLTLNSSYLVQHQPAEGNFIPDNYYSRLRPLAFSSGFPKFMMSRYPNVRNQDMLVSFPTFLQLSHGRISSVAEIKMRGMLMAISPSVSPDRVAEIKKSLTATIAADGNLKIYNFYESIAPWKDASNTIELFGMGTSVLVMIVCFFSLTSSMVANIHEHAREAGILRAIGLGRVSLVAVYVLEAFVLVVSASFLGIVIGSVIGWTVTAQRAVFTQLPVPFKFPYQITVGVIIMALISAVLSSLLPATQLLRQPIVKIMRTI